MKPAKSEVGAEKLKPAFYIGIKDNVAGVLRVSRCLPPPKVPGYKMIGIFDSQLMAERCLPVGVEYQGNIIGEEG